MPYNLALFGLWDFRHLDAQKYSWRDKGAAIKVALSPSQTDEYSENIELDVF